MLQKIISQSLAHNLFTQDSTIILGLSGGPDSVFLLHFLAHCKSQGLIKEVIAVHLDHEWREHSYKDALFCAELAQKYNVPFIGKKTSELSVQHLYAGSREEQGRNTRRTLFEQIQKEMGADYIALAHHMNDQQETFFIRLLRGASLSGLTAMKMIEGHYIRPLLHLYKQEILDYLHDYNIPYVIDASNDSPVYLRNKIRHAVIPALQTSDERFDKNFATTFARLQSTEEYLQEVTRKTFVHISRIEDGKVYISQEKLLELHPVIAHRVIVYWLCHQKVKFPVTENFLLEIIRFIKQPGSGIHRIHHDWSLEKIKKWITISRP